jgi:hypothetical protein
MDYTIAPNVTAIGAGDSAPTTGTKGEFTSGNPATSTPATVLPGYQMNAIVEEIINVISGAGLTPSNSNNAQLLQALTGMAGINIQAFLTSGSWTAPAGTTKVKARVWAGGGAGGAGVGGGAGGGGSGGGYGEGIFTVIPGNTYVVTVGNGGVGSTANGGPGSASSFGSFITALGGLGGTASSALTSPGAGAGPNSAGSGGALNLPGSGGQNGWALSSSPVCGIGGGSPMGGPPTYFGFITGSVAGNRPGGASSGSASGASLAGAYGLIILEW